MTTCCSKYVLTASFPRSRLPQSEPSSSCVLHFSYLLPKVQVCEWHGNTQTGRQKLQPFRQNSIKTKFVDGRETKTFRTKGRAINICAQLRSLAIVCYWHKCSICFRMKRKLATFKHVHSHYVCMLNRSTMLSISMFYRCGVDVSSKREGGGHNLYDFLIRTWDKFCVGQGNFKPDPSPTSNFPHIQRSVQTSFKVVYVLRQGVHLHENTIVAIALMF